jgi:uncharacterized protein
MNFRSRSAARVALAAGAALLLSGSLNGALAAQQVGDHPAPRVIRVSGTGEVRATPDVAHLDLAVETTGATARAAGEENARAMDRVIRALVAAGVARADIQTRGYSLFPEYAQPDRPPMPRPGAGAAEQQPRIVGYRASNTVTVRTGDVARVGALIDAGLGAGANRLGALRFSLRDAEAAQNQAIREAAERARRTAEAMAAALGVRLGAIVEATTDADVVRPFAQFERAQMMDVAATPVEPGEQTVSATVAVVFAIEGG